MPLKKNMSDAEINKVCKLKPAYEESYNKGQICENSHVEDMIAREGSFIEILKHANVGDGINAITVKIYFNAK